MTPGNTASGSKVTDRMIFGALLAVMLCASPRLPELANFRVDLSSGALQMGMLAVPVASLGTAGALMEYFLATAFWVRRLRWLVAISGILFHFVLTRIVSIFMLDYAAIFLYLAFLLPLIKPASSAPDRNSRPLSARRQGLPAPREA